jgi:quercetin dioxygenase-like cupin family protein
MQPVKTFSVFGDTVDILVDGSMSAGSSAVLIQSVSPGGGPPPHSHANEDETFTALEGEFEMLIGGQWVPTPVGEIFFSQRNSIHTFRNVGTTDGKIAVFVSPAGFEKFLEELSPYTPPKDIPIILDIAKRHGITFHL